MGLFGFGAKRKPVEPRAVSRPKPSFDAPTRPARLAAPVALRRVDQPAGVEVSEFNLDDEDFSSMFGAAASRFADTTLEDDLQQDPWSKKLHL